MARDVRRQVNDYAWSPAGDHLAFSLSDANTFSSIWIWSVADGKLHRVTGEQTHEYSPAWDPKGQYLYFLGARNYAAQLDALDYNFVLDRNIGIYALALRKDVPHPFPPEEDQVALGEEEKKDGNDKKDERGG